MGMGKFAAHERSFLNCLVLLVRRIRINPALVLAKPLLLSEERLMINHLTAKKPGIYLQRSIIDLNYRS